MGGFRFMKKKQIQFVIKALRKLGKKDCVLINTTFGLCANIQLETGIYLSDLPNYYYIISGWKYFSGDSYYPVTCPGIKLRGHILYHSHRNNLWSGEYGEMRRKFARYLAREYTKMLKNGTI